MGKVQVPLIVASGGTVQFNAEQDAGGFYEFHSVPSVGGLAVTTANPLPVQIQAGAAAIGTVSLTAGAALIGAANLSDGVTSANKLTVSQLHNGDKQSISSGTQFSLLASGVNQVVDPNGAIDRQRETGFDNITSVGVTTGAQQFLMQIPVGSGTGAVGSAGAATITPAAMSGSLNGVPWSIQANTPIVYDFGGANVENIIVTSVTGTTFTATFAKTHSAGVSMLVNTYNQERDAAGEGPGSTGQGAATAIEYGDISGGPSGTNNFDPDKLVQGKGQGTAAITTATAGTAQIIFTAAPTGLRAGQQLILLGGTTEEVLVSKTYAGGGATTVPLQGNIVNSSHTSGVWDIFAVNGPELTGFQPVGIGVDAIALVDPVLHVHTEMRQAPGAPGVQAVNIEGTKATYGYGASVTPVATPTDVVTLSGSSSKTIRVLRVTVSGLATTAGSMDASLVKRTAVNTGGTSSAPTPGLHDSADSAATASIAQYSVNPTGLGAGVALRQQKLNFGLTGAAGIVVWDFTTRNGKGLVLRGATQFMALNLNGGAVPVGGVIDYDIEWTEE